MEDLIYRYDADPVELAAQVSHYADRLKAGVQWFDSVYELLNSLSKDAANGTNWYAYDTDISEFIIETVEGLAYEDSE